MMECPVCGEMLSGDALYVARHVWSQHVMHSRRATNGFTPDVSLCWCGVWSRTFQDWLRHMGDQTDVQAHWLEHSLGLAAKP